MIPDEKIVRIIGKCKYQNSLTSRKTVPIVAMMDNQKNYYL